jgi:hypothetical protein
MDANKIKKLEEIDYNVRKCCGLCKHSHISLDGWGICNLHKYKHEKHTGEERQLSINHFGFCSDFELDVTKTEELHNYAKLIK